MHKPSRHRFCWSGLEHPALYGFASFEWNIVEDAMWYSPEWSAITRSDEYEGKNNNSREWWGECVHPEDAPALQYARQSFLECLIDRNELVFRLKSGDGVWRWLFSRAQVTEKTPEGEPLLVSGVCVDITDMLSEKLIQAKETAEAANKAKDAFLANVSHELRTPLNGVLSMLQLMDALPMGELQREYLRTAQSSGRALLRIISDLLDFSCMESGKIRLASEVFAFGKTVRCALNVFADEAAKKGLDCSCRIASDIPRYFMGDETRVRQILFNLVGNALKFTHKGSIAVTCDALPGGAKGRAGVALAVKDTGTGIPRDKVAGIFDAFAQMRSARRRKHSGTGLGLSIVKHLVSMMGGEVSMESDTGKGTTVHCSLYFALPSQEWIEQSARTLPMEKTSLQPMDILVAEDDTVGSLAIRAFLLREGHRVFCVEDGRQALEAMQLYPFHCVFTDIEMPYMGGLELVRRIREGDVRGFPASEDMRSRIREFSPGAPAGGREIDPASIVVAVSAHSMIGDRERFLHQGMDYYISKPILKADLGEALRFVARKRRDLLER